MRTVYHLIQNRTALEVICVNCANSMVLNHRFLARPFGSGKLLAELRFVCRRCQALQERARAAATRIRARRKGMTLGGLSVKDLINEGRP